MKKTIILITLVTLLSLIALTNNITASAQTEPTSTPTVTPTATSTPVIIPTAYYSGRVTLGQIALTTANTLLCIVVSLIVMIALVLRLRGNT